LSESNGVYQIDVLPGYDIAAVLEDILMHNNTIDYDLKTLVHDARTLGKDIKKSVEHREVVVARINTENIAKISHDERLEKIIDGLIQEACKTKIGQRKLTAETILRYQGLCSKYMRTGQLEKELQVRIMMYARGIKSRSFDEYWKEKKLIEMIGIEKFTNN
jgi:hypothetical protein